MPGPRRPTTPQIISGGPAVVMIFRFDDLRTASRGAHANTPGYYACRPPAPHFYFALHTSHSVAFSSGSENTKAGNESGPSLGGRKQFLALPDAARPGIEHQQAGVERLYQRLDVLLR